MLIDHKSIITNDPKKTLNPSLKIFLNSSGRENLWILTAHSAVIVPIISHISSIYFLCAELTPQAYKLCAVTREHLHLQGVPSPQTVHRTVWGFTLCEAPSYYFAVFKAENGDQRRCLWTLARDNIPCIPFHADALYEAITLLSLILIESKCCFSGSYQLCS